VGATQPGDGVKRPSGVGTPDRRVLGDLTMEKHEIY